MRQKAKIQNYFSRIIYLTSSLILIFIGLVLYINIKITVETNKFCFDSINEIPVSQTALVLGTSKYIASGVLNPFFIERMDAAAELYYQKKISYILVSGDNSLEYYNEPIMMKKSLLNRGIPDSVIYLDYAGFRTLDAVIRAKEIFMQNELTIVSQNFHNERAVFIARAKGMKVIAYNAKDVELKFSIKTRIREIFARVKVFIDLYIINKQPKFLGKTIPIGIADVNK